MPKSQGFRLLTNPRRLDGPEACQALRTSSETYVSLVDLRVCLAVMQRVHSVITDSAFLFLVISNDRYQCPQKSFPASQEVSGHAPDHVQSLHHEFRPAGDESSQTIQDDTNHQTGNSLWQGTFPVYSLTKFPLLVNWSRTMESFAKTKLCSL